MLEIVRAVENNTALSVVNSVKTREDIEEKKAGAYQYRGHATSSTG